MNERKPRVAVTLSDEAREVVQRLAELENTSMSKIVTGIVESFLPTARQLADLGEAAQNATAEQKARLTALMQQVEAEVLGKADDASTAFDDVLGQAGGILK